jgi:hypothetical protein
LVAAAEVNEENDDTVVAVGEDGATTRRGRPRFFLGVAAIAGVADGVADSTAVVGEEAATAGAAGRLSTSIGAAVALPRGGPSASGLGHGATAAASAAVVGEKKETTENRAAAADGLATPSSMSIGSAGDPSGSGLGPAADWVGGAGNGLGMGDGETGREIERRRALTTILISTTWWSHEVNDLAHVHGDVGGGGRRRLASKEREPANGRATSTASTDETDWRHADLGSAI